MTLELRNLIPELSDNALVREKLRNTTFVGIDFGTSTTVASYTVFDDEQLQIKTEAIPISQTLPDGRIQESHLVPSVVAWYQNTLFVGMGALQLKSKLVKDRNIWYSFKMDLGIDLGAQYYNSELPQGHRVATIQNPKDVATVFLKYLKNEIEKFIQREGLPSNLEYSISIPASFEANQRRDLIEALELAHITTSNHALIDEPNAAFLSYVDESSLESWSIPEKPLHILVFDFGAGTCDISILEIGNYNGRFYSKNLAISRFIALGGDNIDREIARRILLPQLLQTNNLSYDDLKTVEINKRIIPSLQPIAEQLKIAICKHIESQKILANQLPEVASSYKKIKTDKIIPIKLPKRQLILENPQSTCREIEEIINIFLGKSLENKRDKNSEDLFNIFYPIESALEKADLKPDEIDMILLIGGSVKNPYLQVALHQKYENDCEIEIPRDPQIHVSRGAAIHSLLINGFKTKFLNPITSEPIIVITRDRGLQTIFRSGTEIPCPKQIIDGFYITDEGQQKIQIPICVGNEQKVVTIIEIPSREGFKKGTSVSLLCELTEDKLINIETKLDGKTAKSTQINPFANRELTLEESHLLEIEKAVNNEAAAYGGKPTIPGLIALTDACVKAQNFLRAAELLESVQQMDKEGRYETSISYYYARAGRHSLSDRWAEKAYQAYKSDVNAFNLALAKLREGKIQDYKQLMEEALRINPDSYFTLECYGDYLYRNENRLRGKELLEKAISIMYPRFLENTLPKDDYFRLLRVARTLGIKDIIQKVEKAQEKSNQQSRWFKEENLLAHDLPDHIPNKGE